MDLDSDTRRTPLDIEDYLEATQDASSRTRSVMFVMMVASILMFAAILNSSGSQWMLGRMHRMQKDRECLATVTPPARCAPEKHDTYTEQKIGAYPAKSKFGVETLRAQAVEVWDKHEDALYTELAHSYVDNTMIIKVPFLGFVFDLNDLGLVAGLGFLLILSCYRFFLSREIDNLRISFSEARRQGTHKLYQFYTLLAMRQVFTVPKSKHISRSRFLVLVPKALVWLPFALLCADLFGNYKLNVLKSIADNPISPLHFGVNFLFEADATIAVGVLSAMVTSRLLRMDAIWAEQWNYLEACEHKGIQRTAATAAEGAQSAK